VRYLQLVALTLLGTVVMSMCLMVNEAPTRQSGSGSQRPENPGALPPDLEQQLRKLRAREIETTPLPRSSMPEPVDPPHLPPALQQLRLLEVGARNMILY
jgi:hypothetical protein